MTEPQTLDAVVAFVQRVHAAEAIKLVNKHLDSKTLHNFAVDIKSELLRLQELRLATNLDVKSTPYPGDNNDVLTTVIVRIGNNVHTAQLRASHGMWLYKVWNTPLPDDTKRPRLAAHAHEITNAAYLAAKAYTQEAIDLNDPTSLAKHGITDLSQ